MNAEKVMLLHKAFMEWLAGARLHMVGMLRFMSLT